MRVRASVLLIPLILMLSFSISPVVGKEEAPDFTLVDIDGKLFTLSECPAKVVLIEFFATYCLFCKDALPTFRNLYSEYSRDELELISISPEGEGSLRNFAQQYNMEWIVASDLTGGISDAYLGLDARIPRTFLVANGTIHYNLLGWSVERGDPSNLRSRINSLLSGTVNGGNGDFDGDSDTGQTGPPYMLIAIIGGAVIILLVVGIVIASQLLGWSEQSRKHRSCKGEG